MTYSGEGADSVAAARRMVVIGGDAAGMSAASQARRLQGARTSWRSSPSNAATSPRTPPAASRTGSAATSTARDELIARTPEEHRARDIDLRMRTEVTEIDLAGRPGARRGTATAATSTGPATTSWCIATGARPVPPRPARHRRAGRARRADPGRRPGAAGHPWTAARRRRAVVVGAGYIGVEMAEAMLARGFEVTVLDRGEQPMATLDPDMGRLVHEAMNGLGIDHGRGARGHRDAHRRGRPGARRSPPRTARYPADVVVLGLGVEPRDRPRPRRRGCRWARTAACSPTWRCGCAATSNIWAGGDCVEVLDLVVRPHPAHRAGHPRQQARPGHRHQHRRRLRAPSPAWSAPRSARSATWRSPGRGCGSKDARRSGCASSPRPSSRRAAPATTRARRR